MVTAYYYRQWDGFHMPFHQHEAIEIMYVISGRCTVATEDDAWSLNKGDFIVLDGGVSHRLMVDSNRPCRMMNLEFVLLQQNRLGPSLRQIAASEASVRTMLSGHQPIWRLKDPSEIYHTLKALVMELDAEVDSGSIMTDVLFAELLIQLARLVSKSQMGGLLQKDIYVQNAITYIHHHYDCNIRIEDVAKAVSVHPAYLHRIFKRETGQTVGQYLTNLRIDKAKQLLSRTDIPVTEIGDSIGLNSSQYFSTLFRKHTGRTPRAYRLASQC
jgi:AraC family transcriptional regulator, melibiose operon regulatory protein